MFTTFKVNGVFDLFWLMSVMKKRFSTSPTNHQQTQTAGHKWTSSSLTVKKRWVTAANRSNWERFLLAVTIDSPHELHKMHPAGLILKVPVRWILHGDKFAKEKKNPKRPVNSKNTSVSHKEVFVSYTSSSEETLRTTPDETSCMTEYDPCPSRFKCVSAHNQPRIKPKMCWLNDLWSFIFLKKTFFLLPCPENLSLNVSAVTQRKCHWNHRKTRALNPSAGTLTESHNRPGVAAFYPSPAYCCVTASRLEQKTAANNI